MTQVQLRNSDALHHVSYRENATSTSTSSPTPDKMAEVYDIQQRQARSVDWTAEGRIWGDETRAWVDEVEEVGDEALRG